MRRMRSSLWAPAVLHSSDTVMARNADEPLNLPAPTALVRGPELLLPGELPGKQKGINAGVIIMVAAKQLKPAEKQHLNGLKNLVFRWAGWVRLMENGLSPKPAGGSLISPSCSVNMSAT